MTDFTTFTQQQYFSRPDDERFSSFDDLQTAVRTRRNTSLEFPRTTKDTTFDVIDGGVVVAKDNPTGLIARPTHWGFGQTCSLLGAPADWLRKVGPTNPELVRDSLNHALALRDERDVKLLLREHADGSHALACLTSRSYGRVWDADVTTMVEQILDAHPEFESPWGWGKRHRALFASDRDVHLLFVDGGSIVDGGGERDQLHRGFVVWNSEVGRTVFGIGTFTFRIVCGNFCIHNIGDVQELRIRHTAGAPARFVSEAIPALRAYVTSSAKPLESAVRAAKALLLPAKPEDFESYFTKRGFTRGEVARAKARAEVEEGSTHRLWDMVNGFTACARDYAHADAKVNLEVRAGKLLEQVAA